MPTFAAFQVTPQPCKSRHQWVVLQALSLLPPQAPSTRHGLLLLAGADDALPGPVAPLHSWSLVGRAPENSCYRRMRPSCMLAHGRRYCDTFRDHESYRVDSDGNRSRSQAGSRFVQRGSDIVLATVARHGGRGVVSKVRMRRESMGRSERVVMVVGTGATISMVDRRRTSSELSLPRGCVKDDGIMLMCSLLREHVE